MSVTVSDQWGQATPDNRVRLVRKVTELYGNTGDAELEQRALEFLDDTIKDMNSHLYEFNKVYEQGIPLEAGQDFIVPEQGFYKESLAYLETNGVLSEPLTYLPWVHFSRLVKTVGSNRSGSPTHYAAFNVHDEGRVYLWPVPDEDVALRFTLSLEYYRRIPLLSSTTQLSIPQEVETALVYGAQKRMAIHIKGAADEDVKSLHFLERDALARLRDIDRRSPDAKIRFKLVDRVQRSGRVIGDVYIKI